MMVFVFFLIFQKSMCRMMIIRLVLETMGPERSLECFPIDFGQFLDILRLFEKKVHFDLGTV